MRSTTSSCVCVALLLLIPIPVPALHARAVPVRDTLHHTLSGLDVETARGPNRNPALVAARFLARGHHGLDQVTRGKAMNGFAAHQVASWKAELVQARALVAATARALDLQGWHPPTLQ